jgi:hypothetical protein
MRSFSLRCSPVLTLRRERSWRRGSAVLATARQLGSALGVAAFVAAAGGRRASDLGGFDRAWIIVVITAAITAVAGLTTGRRIAVREVAAKAETAENTAAIACGTSPTGGDRVDC